MPKPKKKLPQSKYVVETVGKRLKQLRTERGMTLTQLADMSGVPASTISKIENQLLRPSLVNAINLAMALEENLGFLVERYRKRPEPVVVIRKDGRDTINYSEMNMTLQDLSGNFFPGALESRVGVLDKGAHSGISPMQHEGEELCFVLSGAIRYRIGDQLIDLASGEYIQFKSQIEHSWENTHPGESTVVWVFSDKLSF
ncbi:MULTISPECIES: XRE family transcriptional regulator [unclassified Beijerinckia]|uniref:helix-turn-helix domain-containing protein n=1 Tax=unclassified Beijerinckia TaxID=2638183 RepID=UPI0008962926|nr:MULTISPECIES: XRE family transcriptional regulator [unclassified Beijerinckia]MDH7799222.1 transcriptional regulator with XRE-family HTH domain [Beijerinckia sp. GAS462]SED91528.1 transcriptional regulator, XRE family with cupin sensor [Beijerinckia sp. 28-YEA-48]